MSQQIVDSDPYLEAGNATAAPARGFVLGILMIVFAINFMDRQLLAMLIEPIKKDLQLSDGSVGLLYGFTFTVFYSAFGIPIARLADRSNRVRIIAHSVLLFSLMTALCGAAGTYLQLLLARIGVGIGEAGTGPPSHSIIADLYPVGRRSTAMSIFSLGPHAGILLGFLSGGLLAQWLGWRSTFQLAGLVGVAVAVLAYVFLKEPPRNTVVASVATVRASPKAVIHALWRHAAMRHLFAGCTVVTIATSAAIGWLPAFLMRSHALSISHTGVVLALLLGVVGGAGTLLSGLLADHLGKRDAAWRLRIVAIAFLIAAPFWTLLLLEDRTVPMIFLLLLPSFVLGFHLGPAFAMVQSLVAPNMRALAASLLLFVGNLVGLGVGPLTVGLLSDAGAPAFGAESLRMALFIIPPLYLWSAYHFNAAARTIAADLRLAAGIGA